MTEHEIDREIAERTVEVGKLVDMHEKLDVPAERFDALREPIEPAERQLAFAVREIDDVDAGAAHAGLMQLLQLAVGRFRRRSPQRRAWARPAAFIAASIAELSAA